MYSSKNFMIFLLPVDFVIIHEGNREYLSIATSKYTPDPFLPVCIGPAKSSCSSSFGQVKGSKFSYPALLVSVLRFLPNFTLRTSQLFR